MVNVAVCQVGSVIYDTNATLKKLQKFTEIAAHKQAQLIVFPEAFIGGYPKGLDFGLCIGTRSEKGRDEFKAYYDSAITYNGKESEIIAECAKKFYVYIAVGVVERSGTTLYCSVFFYGPNGEKLGKHRKIMPTAMERVIWSLGDGSTIPVINTVIGNICAVICWENYMPLLRTAMYQKGVQLYLAPTVDCRETWLPTMRTIAIEGRCYVISVCQFLKNTDYPKDHVMAQGNKKVLISGGSCVIDPFGKILLEPNFNEECVSVIDCNLDEIIRGKFDLDVVGHYSRPDLFTLYVNEKDQNFVEFKNN